MQIIMSSAFLGFNEIISLMTEVTINDVKEEEPPMPGGGMGGMGGGMY